MALDLINQRQLDLGVGLFFRPEAENPPANQIRVKAGFLYSGARDIVDQFTTGDQTTAGFASVAVGFERYDLVYLDTTGAVAIAPGTPVVAASSIFSGAPGFSGGPALPDQAVPVAYVFVDETAAVIVNDSDIFDVRGVFQQTRDLDGYCVDKGLLGAAPTGASDVVTALFAGEVPGASTTAAGIITAPPSNYVHILDHKRDEIVHTATGSRVYGRITEAASVWTISYFFTDVTGAETAIGDISTDVNVVPTDLRLVGTPKVFSRNDPTRPLFVNAAAVISDQIVGDIPDASETVKGKVELATSAESTAGLAVQASDTRLPTQDENDALLGAATSASGVPDNTNRYVLDDDSRFAGTFTPRYHQANASAGAGATVVFGGTVISSGISVDGSGNITFTDTGVYQFNVTMNGPAPSSWAFQIDTGGGYVTGVTTNTLGVGVGTTSHSMSYTFNVAVVGTHRARVINTGGSTSLSNATHITIDKVG